jgi:hypothetical protein
LLFVGGFSGFAGHLTAGKLFSHHKADKIFTLAPGDDGDWPGTADRILPQNGISQTSGLDP